MKKPIPRGKKTVQKTTKILSCVNLKGGVGKTALAVNFAAYVGRKGFKTLLIDLDPQTNATFSCVTVDRWQEHAKQNGTVENLLAVKSHTSAENRVVGINNILMKDVFKNVDLIPSHQNLFTIDLDLAGASFRETKLKKALTPKLDDYEIIVCDCPPNLTIPTQNALAVSTHYVIPVSPDFLSVLGVALLINRINEFTENMGGTIKCAGIVMSRVGRKAVHREENMEGLKMRFGDLVIDQQIDERVKVSESAGKNKSIFDMRDAKSSKQFSQVSEEILSRMEMK